MKMKPIYYLGLIIAIGTSSMCTVFSLLFINTISVTLFVCVFLATYAFYAIDRLVGADADKASHPDRSQFFETHRIVISISILIAIIVSIYISAIASFHLAILVAIAPFISLLYAGILSKSRLGYLFEIKKVFLLKDAFIAAGWSFLLPFTFLFHNVPMKPEHWLFVIPLFLKLFVMAIIYDFKDIDSDRNSGAKTLPIIIGVYRSKMSLHLLNSIATLFIFLLVGLAIIPTLGLIFIPAFIYQGVNIQLLSGDAPEWVYAFLADLEQFFWLVFIVIGRWLLGAI